MKKILSFMFLTLLLTLYSHPSCWANVIVGWNIESLTSGPGFNESPRINNNNEIVWTHHNGKLSEIVLYKNFMQKVISLPINTEYVTESNVIPDINNQGHVVWRHLYQTADGTRTEEVMLYDGSTVKSLWSQQVTFGANISSLRINDKGQVAWKWRESFSDLYFFNGQNVTAVVTDGLSFGGTIDLNNYGDLVWNTPNLSPDLFLKKGDSDLIQQITKDPLHEQDPRINDSGDIIWRNLNRSKASTWEVVFRDGDTLAYRVLGDDVLSDGLDINNLGHVVWASSFEFDPELLYFNGEKRLRVTKNKFGDLNPSLNDYGTIVWSSADYDNARIDIFKAVPRFIDPNAVPEPTTILLLGSGLLGLAFRRRKAA